MSGYDDSTVLPGTELSVKKEKKSGKKAKKKDKDRDRSTAITIDDHEMGGDDQEVFSSSSHSHITPHPSLGVVDPSYDHQRHQSAIVVASDEYDEHDLSVEHTDLHMTIGDSSSPTASSITPSNHTGAAMASGVGGAAATPAAAFDSGSPEEERHRQVAQRDLKRAEEISRTTLIIFNIIILLFACILIAIGSYALNAKASKLSGETLPAGIIVMGVFLLVLSLLGCLAAYKQNRPALGVYFIVLMLILFMLFFIGIGVYVRRGDSESLMLDVWTDSPADLRHNFENYFECCGRWNATDRENVAGVCDPIYNGTGCISAMASSFRHYAASAGGAGIGFAIILTFALVIVCILMRGIKAREARNYANAAGATLAF